MGKGREPPRIEERRGRDVDNEVLAARHLGRNKLKSEIAAAKFKEKRRQDERVCNLYREQHERQRRMAEHLWAQVPPLDTNGLEHVKAELAVARSQAESRLGELVKEQERGCQLSKELGASKTELATLSGDHLKLTEELNKAQSDLVSVSAEGDCLRQQKEELDKVITELRSQVQELKQAQLGQVQSTTMPEKPVEEPCPAEEAVGKHKEVGVGTDDATLVFDCPKDSYLVLDTVPEEEEWKPDAPQMISEACCGKCKGPMVHKERDEKLCCAPRCKNNVTDFTCEQGDCDFHLCENHAKVIREAGLELEAAIRTGDAWRALKLASGPVQKEVLNRLYNIGKDKQHGTLVHLALCSNMPMVAFAILCKEGFVRITDYMSTGANALHIASGLGELAVCQALIARAGRAMLLTRARESVRLIIGDLNLVIRKGKTAADLARANHVRHDISMARHLERITAQQ